MRYYDTQITPMSGKTFLEDGVNRIIQTDERVSSWFEPLPEGHQRAYTADGLPFNEPIPEKSAEELAKIAVKEIEASIQSMLDNKAKELGYDSIVSACSYAGYTNDFQTEAIALGTWRSAVWSKAYELQATMVEIPTVEEIIAQLPKYGEEI